MSGPDYWPPDIPRDDITRSDKEAMFREDRLRNTSTYFDQARISEKLDPENKEGSIYPGRDPYPAQDPATSPWTNASQLPPEEPLGFSVDEIGPMGEPHEQLIAAQIVGKRNAATALATSNDAEAVAVAPSSSGSSPIAAVPSPDFRPSSSDVEPPTSPIQIRKRRFV